MNIVRSAGREKRRRERRMREYVDRDVERPYEGTEEEKYVKFTDNKMRRYYRRFHGLRK